MRKIMTAAFILGAVSFAGQAGAADRATAQFMRQAALASRAEVELSRIAQQRGDERDVRQFAGRMVSDHSRAADELERLAEREGVRLPDRLDGAHRAAFDRLRRLRGDTFDRAYMAQMTRDHDQAVSLFRSQARFGRDRDVREWAERTLPTLEHHRMMARDLFREERRETRRGY